MNVNKYVSMIRRIVFDVSEGDDSRFQDSLDKIDDEIREILERLIIEAKAEKTEQGESA